MWVSTNGIWLLPTCALGSHWSVAALRWATLTSESALRRDLLPRLTAVIYRTELAVTDEPAVLEKLPHLSLSRPLKERETLMQADGTEKGYNYVSVPPQVLAGYPAVLDVIKPSLPRSSPNPFRSHRRQPVLCVRSRPSSSKIRRVRISLVAGCFTSEMKLLAGGEWGKQRHLLLMRPLVEEKWTS